jgi:hypothetical protein
MPTRKVDATENSDMSRKAGISNSRNSRKSRNSGKHRNEEKSEVRLVRKVPEHRTVGIPTRSETPKPCSEDARNTEEAELPTGAETLEVRLERKMSGNLDIWKKES